MILTDASILMYAAGAEHAYKAPSVAYLQRVASGAVEATIDAEVFPEVLAITGEVMDEARRILATDATVTARDAVHAAVVIIYQLEGICSFDADFDRIAGCTRVSL